MKKARIAALVLAVLMVSSVVSCGKDEGNDKSNDTTPADTTSADEMALAVPKTDFDEKITYLRYQDDYTTNFRLLCDDTKGDVLNEAGYNRMLAVSEHLGVEFDAYTAPNFGIFEALNTSIMSGTKDYDFVLPHCQAGVAALLAGGVLLDWSELDYVDFSKPWWNSTMQESLGIAGKTYFASGDITMTWQGMQGIVFNKDYLEKYNIEDDLYELVWDGEWTMDKMLSLVAGTSDDISGDNKMTEVDQFGYVMNSGMGVAYTLAMGQNLTKVDDGGCPVLDMGTERMLSIVEKYYALTQSEGTFQESYSNARFTASKTYEILTAGRTFMCNMDIGGLYMGLRELNYDFGILPLPKLDADQEDYYVGVASGIIGVPLYADPEIAGAVAETLAYYSYEYVRPAFFDVVLQNKALRDEESYDMLTLMHESKIYDFGWNFTTASGLLDSVVVSSSSTDFMSHYATQEESVNSELRNIYDAVLENE